MTSFSQLAQIFVFVVDCSFVGLFNGLKHRTSVNFPEPESPMMTNFSLFDFKETSQERSPHLFSCIFRFVKPNLNFIFTALFTSLRKSCRDFQRSVYSHSSRVFTPLSLMSPCVTLSRIIATITTAARTLIPAPSRLD